VATRTQDLVFTLYGDYLLPRGGTAWIGSLIELLGRLDVSEQAVRSAASRMARKGWLSSEKCGRHSYYSLTPKAVSLLEEGARQIFNLPQDEWDGNWYLITYAFSDEQTRKRHRLRNRLSWIGFGQLNNGTMISPRYNGREVNATLCDLEAHSHVHLFRARSINGQDNDALARESWDLEELGRRYEQFVTKYQPQFERDLQVHQNGKSPSLSHYFQQRFWLMHEYRYFPFHDPYLPSELLPEGWMGNAAATLFQKYHSILQEKAFVYVNKTLAKAPQNSFTGEYGSQETTL
jgi:phenylacetic acid degradation operon negative regulatory protein